MRTARALITSSFLVLGTACGEPDVEPRDGAWDYMGSAIVDDTCMLDQFVVDTNDTFTITNNGDGTFTVNDTANEFDCMIEGSDFSCPTRLAAEEDVGAQYGFEATVSYNVSVTGSLSSETAMTGRQEIVVECAGADCPKLEAAVMVTTPCGWAQEFTASAG